MKLERQTRDMEYDLKQFLIYRDSNNPNDYGYWFKTEENFGDAIDEMIRLEIRNKDMFFAVRDRIEKVFKELREVGYVAEHNVLCCQTCAIDILEKHTDKWIYYHEQDTHSWMLEGNHLHLGYSENTNFNLITHTLDKHKICWECEEPYKQRIKIKGYKK
jgi:hypothetical protein